MMDVSAANLSSTATQTQSSQSTKSKTLDYDSFLQLLIAELKSQDPTQPMDPTQQVSQLASFSAVEQQVNTNDGVIGRTLTSADGETTGKVTSVRIVDGGGAVATLDNGGEVTLGSGVQIS
jgi:flagellar basal-body rod modification protein FlgD